MNFKRIEIVGFKSFADRTVIPFSEGMTAIVGPNGCGKSNVVDAIRWCLGEQSTKTMRSSSMQEVIFNGTERRKSLSYCEVTMVLDNSNKMFKIDYDEIAITRKLYRSGESEYLMNNTPCRLKDITTILYDSGLGKDGYSIVSQGQVAEILNSKPEQRRAIFEEAAGIAKYKGDKKINEAKLERTRNNLTQIQIVLTEIERQLGPLLEQAEAAKKYLNLREQLKKVEVNNYIYQYENANEIKGKIKVKIDALLEEATQKQAVLDEVLTQYNENFEEINSIDKKIALLYNDVVDLKVGLEKKSGETNIIKERLVSLNGNKERLKAEYDSKQNAILNLQNLLQDKTQKREDNIKEISALKEESEKISASYLSVVDELTKNEDEVDQNQQQMISALDKMSDVKSEISSLNTKRDALIKNIQECTENIEVLSNKFKQSSQSLSDLKVKRDLSQDVKQKLLDDQKSLLSRFNEVIFTKRKVEEDLSNVMSQKASIDSRLKFLCDMQRDYEGYNYAVKSILKNSENSNQIKSKFVGVIANLVKVPEKYQSAMDTALGNAIQNIVTTNEDDAAYLIDYLKQNNYGRATFLPLTSVKPRKIDDRFESKIKRAGCYGVACDLIEYDKKLSTIFDSLLGATVVVEDMPAAINLAKDCDYSFKIVTLDGDIVNPQGSYTGGSKKNNANNVLGREREIEETNKVKGDLLTQLNDLSNKKTELDKSYQELELQIKNTNESIKHVEIEFVTYNEQFTNNEFLAKELENSLTSAKEELSDYEQKIADIDNEITVNSTILNNINTNKSSANESISKRQMQFDYLKKERETFNERKTDIKVKIAQMSSENIALENDLVRLKDEITYANEYLEDIDEKIVQNSNAIIVAESAIKEKAQQSDLKEITDELAKVQEKLASLDTYKASLQDNLKVLDEQRLSLTSVLAKLQDRRYSEEMNLAKVDTDIENMQERIWEEYKLTYSTALDFKREDHNLNKGISEANKLKREIENLGYVNVNAIEESKALQERYDDSISSVEDLRKAEEDLTKIIKNLTIEMVNRFNIEFEKIKANFSKVFKELFGGGNAELILVESESGDVLEAGVDIKAVPPGKKISNISQLSGGERALTAIAILFAILRLRPMPFCLLDEMEAALDEANVVRFAKYLKRFTDETQFIVITHRKPTMELADNMFGVTMEEKGVSKVVSVKLNDALEHAVVKEEKDISI